jgi:uncharacterized protein (DUF433 family)
MSFDKTPYDFPELMQQDILTALEFAANRQNELL